MVVVRMVLMKLLLGRLCLWNSSVMVVIRMMGMMMCVMVCEMMVVWLDELFIGFYFVFVCELVLGW